jgi:cytochrome c peroxidase
VAAGQSPDEASFPLAARRGLRAFLGKAQCVNCHNGPLFTDAGFHNLGTPPPPGGRSRIDIGRSLGAQQVKSDPFRCGTQYSDSEKCEELRFLNPQFEDFLGAFKTPTLRNVAKTGPYFHSGQVASLEELLAFYKALPGQPEIGHRELILGLLDPKVDSSDLVAFLHTLTGPLPDARWLVPPKE